MEYPSRPVKRTILFKCEWFDPTLNIVTRVHPKYNIVELNLRRRLYKYEPFVLAQQATQVYNCPYPSLRHDRADWWVVNKIKARSVVEIPKSSGIIHPPPEAQPFQADDLQFHAIEVASDEPMSLVDPNGAVIQLIWSRKLKWRMNHNLNLNLNWNLIQKNQIIMIMISG